MKRAGPLKPFIVVFLFAAIVYFAAFYAIEHRRTRNGPWRVAFASAGDAAPPFLIINEPKVGISDLRIVFSGQTAAPTNAVMVIDHPQEVPFDVPFGQCIFLDVMSQPGTATFLLFGHEIQLLPRVLTIDKKEIPWRSNTNLTVAH